MSEIQRIELGGVDYVVVRRDEYEALCRRAGAQAPPALTAEEDLARLVGVREPLGERLVGRRRSVGLSQAELARRAGIRVETLNRIERGRTRRPDYATLRKLVDAIQAARKEESACPSH